MENAALLPHIEIKIESNGVTQKVKDFLDKYYISIDKYYNDGFILKSRKNKIYVENKDSIAVSKDGRIFLFLI